MKSRVRSAGSVSVNQIPIYFNITIPEFEGTGHLIKLTKEERRKCAFGIHVVSVRLDRLC